MRDPRALAALVSVLVEIGDAHGTSGACVALAWTLAQPGITSLVLGARTEAQLTEDLTAARLTPSADERARLDAVTVPHCSTRIGIRPSWRPTAFSDLI